MHGDGARKRRAVTPCAVRRGVASAVLAAAAVITVLTPPPAAAAGGRAPAASVGAGSAPWLWPTTAPRTVVRGYDPPRNRYGAGHRGVDIAAGAAVVAPAAGTVAFAGRVADRPLITIELAPGVVATFEPVDSPLVAGAVVRAGDVVGTPASGGHAAAGTVHLGVRVDGEYVNPLAYFQSARRAVLLPCC